MPNILRFDPNPVTDYLQANWLQIREEYLEFRRSFHGIEDALQPYTARRLVNKPQVTTLHERRPIYEGNINVLPLMFRPEAASPADRAQMPFWQDDGREMWKFERVYEAIPTLGQWATKWEKDLASLVFYLNQPGSWVRHHYGPETNVNNFRLHMGLTTDPLAEFDLENERYSWSEGDIMGFDDSNVYHGVRNLSSRPRLIIAFDIKKSLMMPWVRGYEPREFIKKELRTPPEILNWE